MKKFSAIVLLLFFVINGNAQTAAPKFETAIEYNDYIVNQQTAVGEAFNKFMEVMDDTTSSKETCNQHRLIALEKVKQHRDNVKAMPSWKGDAGLRDTALLLFNFYVKTVEVHWATLVDLVFTEPFTEEVGLEMDKVLAELTADEAVYDSWFLNCQERFALKYGFTLSE